MAGMHARSATSPAAGIAITLVLHYGWELAQAPLFTDHAGEALAAYALHCFVAAVGDVLIAAGAYAVTAVATARPWWALEPRWGRPAVLWVSLGLLATVAFELIATATGRWTYGPAMPSVFGIGVTPLLQWMIVPPMSLLAWRAVAPGPWTARDRDR